MNVVARHPAEEETNRWAYTAEPLDAPNRLYSHVPRATISMVLPQGRERVENSRRKLRRNRITRPKVDWCPRWPKHVHDDDLYTEAFALL